MMMIIIMFIFSSLLFIIIIIITNYYNMTSAVYARLSVNWDMVKHFEALGLLTTSVMFLLYQPTSQLLH